MGTYKGAGIAKGKAMPIFPWIGPAYLSCKTSRVNGTDWSECSDSASPSWDGYPGCHLTTNPWGWQVCTAFGCASHPLSTCTPPACMSCWLTVFG
jgi:hypothetical protein